jgi:hypothetical protein
MRYYISSSDDELVNAKAAIGAMLRTAKVKGSLDDIKINIALINDEIAARKKNDETS